MRTLKKINTVTTVAKQSTTDIQAINAEKVEKHYQLINGSFEKSVKELLQTARCVYDAKQSLNKESFKALAKRFGSESSLSKLLTIGEKVSSRFSACADRLPSAHQALYALARLEDAPFNEALNQGKIYSCMTGADASALLNGRTASSTSVLYRVVIFDDESVRKIQSDSPGIVAKAFAELHHAIQQCLTLGLVTAERVVDASAMTIDVAA